MLICCIIIAPTAAPGNFFVNATSSSSVSLNWTKPDKSVLHGNLQRYAIQYRRVECNESDPVPVSNQNWTSVNVTNTTLTSTITKLEFWSCYKFQIMAVTVGDGPFSSMIPERTKQHGMLTVIFMPFYFFFMDDLSFYDSKGIMNLEV